MHKIRKTKLFPMILAFLVLVSCGAAFSQVTRWRHNHLVRDNVGSVFSDQDLSVIAPGSTNTYKFQVQASTGNIYASGSFFVGGATVYTTLYAGSVYATNSVATNTYSDTLWATSSYITHLISNDINTVGLWATTVTATTTYSGDSYADYLVVGGTTSNVELTGAGAINASSTIYSATAIGVPETTGAINLNFGTGTKQIMADADSMNLMMDTTDQLELQSALAPVFVVDGGGNVFASGGMNMATASIAWDVTMTGGSLALLSGGISAATTSFTNASITNQIDAASATFTNNVMLTDLVASGTIYGVAESLSGQLSAASGSFVNNVTANDFVASGTFYGDGSGITGVLHATPTLDSVLTAGNTSLLGMEIGSATVTAQVSATDFYASGSFYGDGSHLTGLPANTLDSVLTSGNVTSQDAYVHSIIASGTLYASDTSFSSGTVNGDFYITGKLTVDGSIDPIDGTFSGVLSSAASDIGDVAYATDSNYPLEVVATNTASGIKIYNTSAGTTGVAITTSHLKSPAVANDIVGVWNINGRDSGGSDTTYSQIYSKVNDATNATETASLYFNTVLSGTATSALYVDGLNKKVVTPLQTAFTYDGGAPFTVANSTVVTNLNADMLDGTSATGFATLAGNNTFTGVNAISAVGAAGTPAKLTFTETSTSYDAGVRKFTANSEFEIYNETALASGVGDGSILDGDLIGSTSTVYTGLTAGDAWSISAFINSSATIYYVVFPATGTGAGGHNGLYITHPSGIVYVQYVNAAGVAKQKPCDFGAGGVPSGSRYFLAVTHDASDNITCTLDGTLVTGGAEAAGSSLYGAYGVFVYGYGRAIMLNELRLYKGTTVLSASDIVNLWVAGAGTEDTDVGVTGTNSLIDRWTFNTNPTTYSIDDVGTIQIAPDSGQWYVWTGTSVTVETNAINITNSATTGLKGDVDISEGLADTFIKGNEITLQTGAVETQRIVIEADGDIGIMSTGSPTALVDIHADSTTKIPLVVQASYGHATETFKIMDSTQAPMIYTEADGTLVFASNATVWDDIRIPGSAAIPSGVTAPALRDFNGSIVQTYQFQPTAASDTLYFQVQIPHGYKLGTDIYPHVHWSPDTDGNGTEDVLWSLNCQVATDSVRFASSTQMWASATVGTDDQWKQKVSYFACDNSYTGDWGAAGQVGCRTNGQAYFEGAELTDISAMFVCRLQRAIGADSFAGYAALGEIDFHFEKDMDGSRNQTTK